MIPGRHYGRTVLMIFKDLRSKRMM